MAYTPGPWEFNQSTLGAYAISARVGPVRVCPAIAHGLEDASLIAAAPDLLDAIKCLRQHLALFCTPSDAVAAEIFRITDAIIAKAEGKV